MARLSGQASTAKTVELSSSRTIAWAQLSTRLTVQRLIGCANDRYHAELRAVQATDHGCAPRLHGRGRGRPCVPAARLLPAPAIATFDTVAAVHALAVRRPGGGVHLATPRELRLAQLVEQPDQQAQAERDRNGEHEGAHRSIADLARS